jgi:hypothetical protein
MSRAARRWLETEKFPGRNLFFTTDSWIFSVLTVVNDFNLNFLKQTVT